MSMAAHAPRMEASSLCTTTAMPMLAMFMRQHTDSRASAHGPKRCASIVLAAIWVTSAATAGHSRLGREPGTLLPQAQDCPVDHILLQLINPTLPGLFLLPSSQPRTSRTRQHTLQVSCCWQQTRYSLVQNCTLTH